MLNIFFEIKGIVHKETVLAGQGVNSAHYFDVLQQLKMCEISSRILATKELAFASRQRAIPHFPFHQRSLDQNNMTVSPTHITFLCAPIKCNYVDTIVAMEAES
jgi:hypothetical protein